MTRSAGSSKYRPSGCRPWSVSCHTTKRSTTLPAYPRASRLVLDDQAGPGLTIRSSSGRRATRASLSTSPTPKQWPGSLGRTRSQQRPPSPHPFPSREHAPAAIGGNTSSTYAEWSACPMLRHRCPRGVIAPLRETQDWSCASP